MIDADREQTIEEALTRYRSQVAENRWGIAARILNGLRPEDAAWVIRETHNIGNTSLVARRAEVSRLLGEIGFDAVKLRDLLRKYSATLRELEGPIAEAAAKLDE